MNFLVPAEARSLTRTLIESVLPGCGGNAPVVSFAPMEVAVLASKAGAVPRYTIRNAPGTTGLEVVPVKADGTIVMLLVPATLPGPVAVTTVSPGARPLTCPSVPPALAIVVSPVVKVGLVTPARAAPFASL